MLSPNMRIERWAAAGAANAKSMQNNSVLTARGIGKTVKSGEADLVILREIDLEVTRGEALAVVGASGSGKSTLLAILAGLDTPSTGAVTIAANSPRPQPSIARSRIARTWRPLAASSVPAVTGTATGMWTSDRRWAASRPA